MTDLRNLIIGKGSEAALAVDKAKAGVEEARAGIEEAKQRLEEAKSHLSDMNAAFDAVLVEMEEAGLSKAKARKAIEEINQTLFAIGAIAGEDTVTATAPAAEKPVRRKRKEKSEEASETEELSGETKPETPVTVEPAVVEEALGDAATETVAEVAPAAVEVVVPSEPEAGEAEVQDQTSVAGNDADISEIVDLIDEATADFDVARVEAVKAILNDALSIASSVAAKEGAHLDLEYFRAFLSDIARDPEQDAFNASVYDAFGNVITAVEDQAAEIKFVLPAEEVLIEEAVVAVVEEAAPEVSGNEDVVDPIEEPVAVVATIKSAEAPAAEEIFIEEAAENPSEEEAIVEDVVDDLDQYTGNDDEMVDDYEEYQSDDYVGISDDETFPISGEEEVTSADVSVVDNIDDMNFLEDAPAAETPAVAAEEAPKGEATVIEPVKVEEEPKKEAAEAPKPRKPFAPPPFLKR
ncbi:hypothetical protein [Mesorhizobium sp. SP-1A]|uniref:hypothetical protein n=1 Tax=Mesorhizobium sp. SP-1A TaxID=3077840 RepID=UPI0028F7362E|nr:hypothetical protein [Mesorhizobium sp. SP-1A]